MSFSYTYKELRKLGKKVVFKRCKHKNVSCKNRLYDGRCCVKECVVVSDSVKPIRSDFRVLNPKFIIKKEIKVKLVSK